MIWGSWNVASVSITRVSPILILTIIFLTIFMKRVVIWAVILCSSKYKALEHRRLFPLYSVPIESLVQNVGLPSAELSLPLWVSNRNLVCRICGSHSGGNEEFYLLRYLCSRLKVCSLVFVPTILFDFLPAHSLCFAVFSTWLNHLVQGQPIGFLLSNFNSDALLTLPVFSPIPCTWPDLFLLPLC